MFCCRQVPEKQATLLSAALTLIEPEHFLDPRGKILAAVSLFVMTDET